MKHKPDKSERRRVTFNTTPQAFALLEALVETGIYGRNYHEAAERLMTDAIQRRLHIPLRRAGNE